VSIITFGLDTQQIISHRAKPERKIKCRPKKNILTEDVIKEGMMTEGVIQEGVI
jgi:hypothetical protein